MSSEEATEPSRDDRLVLELLGSARKRRALDILEAAKRARKPDDDIGRNATYSGILAQEVMSFHKVMMTLNRRIGLRRFMAGSALRTSRGEISHYPTSHFGNNHYLVSTPLLLRTPVELVQDAGVEDGYIFRTYHMQKTKGQTCDPMAGIDHVVRDIYSGAQTVDRDGYIIHVYHKNSGHPVSHARGGGIGIHEVTPADDPRLVEPIGLLRLAIEELSQ